MKPLRPAQDQQLLPAILSKTSASLEDFARQVVDLSAHEQITQETLRGTARRKSSEYSYLVLVHRNDLSGSTPEEYRVDAKGNRVVQGGLHHGYAVTSGFVFECLHFLPANQPDSNFRFLGTEPMGRTDYLCRSLC